MVAQSYSAYCTLELACYYLEGDCLNMVGVLYLDLFDGGVLYLGELGECALPGEGTVLWCTHWQCFSFFAV